MRPYLAIIKDSFRAAIASRVLYVLLALITLFLLAIAPFGLSETLTTTVSESDILPRNGRSRAVDLVPFLRLTDKIVKSSQGEEKTQKKLIWDRLSPETQVALKELDKLGNEPIDEAAEEDPNDAIETAIAIQNAVNLFLGDINRVVEDEDLYEEGMWRKERLGEEATELIEQHGGLTDERRRRLNRILVSGAFPAQIARGPTTSLQLNYAFKKLGTIPLRREHVKTQLGSWLPYVLDKFVLSIGVFIAILVTAPLIPQTFDAGALNLLLSKPVSRSMLLISKFIGGCAFVAICAVYLFVGMWLIFGIRLGIWNNAILISIPIYIVVFAIYYSVSASAGVIWRNTVICVVLAILFWLACFSVGLLNSMFSKAENKQQFTSLIESEDATFGTDDLGATYRWNESTQNWEMVLLENEVQDGMLGLYFMSAFVEELGLASPLGPVYLAEYDQIVGGNLEFPPQAFRTDFKLTVSSPENSWDTDRVAPLPAGAFMMLKDHNGKLLVASRDGGLYRLKIDPLKQFREDTQDVNSEKANEDDGGDTSENGAEANKKEKPKKPNPFSKLLFGSKDSYFERLKIEGEVEIASGPSVAVNQPTGQIAICTTRDITFLEPSGGGYAVSNEKRFDLPGDLPVATDVALGGDYLLAVRGNGNLLLYDLDRMELLETFQPEAASVFRSVSAAPNGERFAVTFTNGNLWIVNSLEKTVEQASVNGQGDISVASLSGKNKLLIADRINRVTTYNSNDYSKIATHAPSLSWVNWINRYMLRPFYYICPKPGEFYKLIDHLTRSKSTDVDRTITSAADVERSSPWSPLWSGLGFMVIVLILACIYFERQEY